MCVRERGHRAELTAWINGSKVGLVFAKHTPLSHWLVHLAAQDMADTDDAKPAAAATMAALKRSAKCGARRTVSPGSSNSSRNRTTQSVPRQQQHSRCCKHAGDACMMCVMVPAINNARRSSIGRVQPNSVRAWPAMVTRQLLVSACWRRLVCLMFFLPDVCLCAAALCG
jgi:hypothetical protein